MKLLSSNGMLSRDRALSFGEYIFTSVRWKSFFLRLKTWNSESSICVLVWIALMLFLTKVRMPPFFLPTLSLRKHWYPLTLKYFAGCRWGFFFNSTDSNVFLMKDVLKLHYLVEDSFSISLHHPEVLLIYFLPRLINYSFLPTVVRRTAFSSFGRALLRLRAWRWISLEES